MKKQLLIITMLTFISAMTAFGQSTDAEHPTPITSSVLTGTVRGSNSYIYSLKSKRGRTVKVNVELTPRGDGSQAFSLDFRGGAGVDGGQTECCQGETYLPLSGEPNLKTSFTVITDERFLMFLNFSTAENSLPFRITFEGLDFDEEPIADADTIIVPGDSGTNWVDTGIDVRRGDRITLSATGTVAVGGSWGTHDANGTTKFARVGGYPLSSSRRYGLAAKIGSQKWTYSGAGVTAVRDGRLYLTCNDDSPADNNGKFVVKVRITRSR